MLRPVKTTEPAESDLVRERQAEEIDLDNRARAALGGDPAALRRFFVPVVPIVRRICSGIMGRDNVELEDAIQDCLIEIARALPHFRFESKVSHYVTKISMRCAIACRQRARAHSRQHSLLETSTLLAAKVDPAQEASTDLVRHLLDSLNEEQAKALLLHVMLGHSAEEIGVLTGVSANTVKTRLRLGKEQLRRWLDRRGEKRREGR